MIRLPIGYDIFRDVVERKLDFVDKSLLIQEMIEEDAQSIVITRPRRFGKTLNLSMLHHFLASETWGKSTQGLFDGLKIMHAGEQYVEQQGKYPVIFITLKDIKDHHYETAYAAFCKLMSRVYTDHYYLLSSEKLLPHQKKVFESIVEERATEQSIYTSLLDLTRALFMHHDVNPWLLIDEYDSPIQASYMHGYYQEMMGLMRNVFGSVLKTNPYLHKAVITGILRVAKESLFSGVNNLRVYSLLHSKYSQYFGFTEAEMDALLKKSDLKERSAEIKAWYNGYQVGDTVVYNPEAFYHGLMLGLTASLHSNPNYEIKSNRESGYGRYDYMIFSSDKSKPTILLEFKRVEKVEDTKTLEAHLEKSAQEAMEQMTQGAYLSEAKQRGCTNILQMGIAFCGKRFKMVHAQ